MKKTIFSLALLFSLSAAAAYGPEDFTPAPVVLIERQAEEECVYLKRSNFEPSKSLTLVIVPSAFEGNGAAFETAVRGMWPKISSYEPFGAGVNNMNVIVAKKMSRRDSFCRYDGRLLLCDNMRARRMAGRCAPGVNRHVLTLHNSTVYGGAGGPFGSTASLGDWAAEKIVHELGHGMFNLSDEYVRDDAGVLGGNCTSSRNCNKWKDLIDAGLATCRPGCRGNAKYTSDTTIMDVLSSHSFGHVNTRLICCAFKKKTGQYPQMCNTYMNVGVGLDRFCGGTSILERLGIRNRNSDQSQQTQIEAANDN